MCEQKGNKRDKIEKEGVRADQRKEGGTGGGGGGVKFQNRYMSKINLSET